MHILWPFVRFKHFNYVPVDFQVLLFIRMESCHLVSRLLWQVGEVYRLHRETFFLAADFIDRYLSKTRNTQKQQLQLIGVTALFVAAKLEVWTGGNIIIIHMEYIVHGSENQNDSNFKLTLERVCRNEWAMFRSASTDLDHALVVCDFPRFTEILPPVFGWNHRQPMHDL